MKDHEIRELVNQIRDIAIEYHGTQQLRERIAHAIRAAMLQSGNSPVIPDGYVMVPKEPTEAMMLHNSGCQHHAWDDPDCAMRQTRRLIWSHMLAAAPQESINALIPLVSRNEQGGDRWIPVSERMPEDEQEVIVQTHSGWRYVSFYDAHSRLFFDSPDGDIEHILVTHWMPLPAAPQEMK